MSYQEEYQQKLTTAEKAVACVDSGMWLDYGWSVCTPVALDKALAQRMEGLTDVNIRGGILTHRPAIFDVPNAAEHFAWNSWHMSGVERKAVKEGFSYYIPLRYSELPGYYRDCIKSVDVAMFQVPPMDEHGNFSFSLAPSHLYEMCARAKHIVVEVNKNLPPVYGLYKTELNIADVTYVVEGDNPSIPELGSVPPTDVDRTVANLIVPEIPNGACLQLGIGGMPNTVGALIAESDLKDLGVHTEMYVDAFVDIAKAGKITGKNKSLDYGRQVYAFAAGTKKLYDYVNMNPEVMGAPVDYTNDVRVIAQLDNFISINNIVDLDLFGQVNAESAGTKQISGTGGQLDFVMGAYLSNGGKSFICLSSSMKGKDGELKSRIVPTLTPGSICTDPRSTVQYLVTEYGMINLKGLNTWERAEKIISIAHPQFRDELIASAEKMGIWRKSNKR